MMLCYSKTRKIKYVLPSPPPPIKRLKDTNGRDMSTRTGVCLYQQPVTCVFTRSILSRLSDSDYNAFDNLFEGVLGWFLFKSNINYELYNYSFTGPGRRNSLMQKNRGMSNCPNSSLMQGRPMH